MVEIGRRSVALGTLLFAHWVVGMAGRSWRAEGRQMARFFADESSGGETPRRHQLLGPGLLSRKKEIK